MGAMWEQPSDSNTTLVKVKSIWLMAQGQWDVDSNTTLVKVKFISYKFKES